METQCKLLLRCIRKLTSVYTKIGIKFGKSLWRFGNGRPGLTLLNDSDPFKRHKPAGLDAAVARFIIGEQNWSATGNLDGYPLVYKDSLNLHSQPINFIPTGMTAGFKCVTTAGVYLPRSSYEVYVSTFKPMVWCSLLLIAVITVSVLTLYFQTQDKQEGSRLLKAQEVFFWMFSSTFGQYKHANIPTTGSSSIHKGFRSVHIAYVHIAI